MIIFSLCRLWYNSCLCFFISIAFFLIRLLFFLFFWMNLFVIRLVMNLVTCTEAAMRNIQHVFIALLWFGCAFLVFSFYRENPEKLWILFSDTVLSSRVVNISPAQKTNNMFCSFTTNKKSSSLLPDCVCGLIVWLVQEEILWSFTEVKLLITQGTTKTEILSK